MITTVISDLGQVILWFDNDIFVRKLAAFCGLSAEKVRDAAHWNHELIESFDSGRMSPQDFYEHVTIAIGVRMDRELFFGIYNDIFKPNPPILAVLSQLKNAGYGLILLSNTDRERFGHIRRNYKEIFIFEDYILSYEVGVVKPHPAIYEAALKSAGCRPEEAVFIDDLPQNVEAAIQLGMKGLRYSPDVNLEAEFKRLGLSFQSLGERAGASSTQTFRLRGPSNSQS